MTTGGYDSERHSTLMQDAGFHAEAYPRQAYEDVRRAVEVTEDVLRSAGLRLPDSGRFARYRRALDAFLAAAGGRVDARRVDLLLLHQGLLELEHLRVIVQGLSRAPAVPDWRERLQPILAGDVHPQRERGVTRPRDFQFELYLGALARLGGCEVELPDPPDVLMRWSGGELAIAAKRPKSVKSLAKRIGEAGRQVASYGRDGIIALDLSVLCNRENRVPKVSDQPEALRAGERPLLHFLETHAGDVRRLAPDRSVVGLIVVFSGLFRRATPLGLGSVTTLQSTNLCGTDDHRFGVLRAAMERLREGLWVAHGDTT